MARVKVRWQTVEQWEAELDIPDYEPDCGYVEDSWLAELESDGPPGPMRAAFLGCIERDVLEETVMTKED